MICAILTDIEGTTSSIRFVKDVLFPYARQRLPSYVRDHIDAPRVRSLIGEAHELARCAPNLDAVIDALLGWIDADVKAPPLKELQGLIWEEGYASGAFRGHVYPDVAPRLERWNAEGRTLAVFSSGSVPAQRLLFGHSDAGDLTPLFTAHFDTRTGAKQAPAAYIAIARSLALPPSDILFLSDVPAELDAAQTAGLFTCQLLRDGLEPCGRHPAATSFDEIDPDRFV